MPTTLEEAIHIIHQLQAENAALKQQLADLTEQLAQAPQAQQKARPTVCLSRLWAHAHGWQCGPHPPGD